MTTQRLAAERLRRAAIVLKARDLMADDRYLTFAIAYGRARAGMAPRNASRVTL